MGCPKYTKLVPHSVPSCLCASVENRWCQLRDTVQSTALAVHDRARRQHQDWFDDNDAAIRNLLAEKNRLQKAYVDHPTDATKAAFYRSRRQLQQRLREMQDAWTARKAEEIQGYADRNEWKNFFSAIKAVYGPPTKGTAPLLSPNGNTLLTKKTQILQRWAEHFRGVLNRPSVIFDAAIERLPQVETNVDLDLPPSLQETIRAVQQLSSGKAPGSDAIPAERKGNRQVCDNHRGISLLNIAGKIFARILLNCLNNHLEQGLLPESQCGFRRHRGTTDTIFAARQLQEKCQGMRTHLYSTFVDLTKAFDTVNREGLWKIMQKFGCPERFTQMVRQLHDGNHLDAPPIAVLAAARLRSRLAVRSTGRAGDQGDLRRPWLEAPPSRHLHGETPSASPQEATGNCTASQLRWINAFDGEVVDSEVLDGAPQKHPQPPSTISDATINRLLRVEVNIDPALLPSRILLTDRCR
nr:unnamed protein product [Spirometra erinaceieuropaei]